MSIIPVRVVSEGESGTCLTDEGAAGPIEFQLPPAREGLTYEFRNVEGHEMRITGGAETISLPDHGDE